MKVVALGAHPDDIEIYMYGLLSNFASTKNQIRVAIATDGAKGMVKESHNLASIRKTESINGLSKFGLPTFLDLPDGELSFSSKNYHSLSFGTFCEVGLGSTIVKKSIFRIYSLISFN